MLGALNIRQGTTAPKTFRVQEAGVALNLTGYTISLRVSTSPVTEIPCSSISAAEGTCSFVPATIPVGIWQGNFVLTVGGAQSDNNIEQTESELTLYGTARQAGVLSVTAATPSGTPVQVLTVDPLASYKIQAFVYGGDAQFIATADIIGNAGGAIIHNLVKGAYMDITASGTGVFLTQSSGGDNAIYYKIL